MRTKHSFGRYVAVTVMAAAVVTGAAAPALALTLARNRSIDTNDQIVLVGRVVVGPTQQVDDVVVFHGPVTVLGTVSGSVTVFDGDVIINGTVQEDVTVFNGSLTLGASSHVGGDVTSRERPRITPGAQVDGSVKRFPIGRVSRSLAFAGRIVVWIAVTVSTFLLGLFLVLFMPRAADAVAWTGRERVGASVGIGFAVFFGFPIAAFVALVTLVGIPLGLGMLLGMALLYWVGYTWSAWFLGRSIMRTTTHRVVALLVGVVILRLVAIVPFLGGLVWLAAAVFGLGAMTVAAARARRGPVMEPAPPQTAPPTPPPPVETMD